MTMTLLDGPLARTVETSATDYWNDSCAVEELEYAVARGATGATSNPSIVLEVLRHEQARWLPRVRDQFVTHPAWGEVELTWDLIEAMVVRGAAVLEPVFERHGGRKGRLSVQTNPAHYRDAARMVDQGVHLAGLAPNLQVKFPVTTAGLVALEEATARGVTVTATVCFTVAQALAAAEAIERGLDRRARDGGDEHPMVPACTLMIGRLDDWLKAVVERDGLAVEPSALDWAGIAVFKRTYEIFQARGYRSRLLAAAFRHRLHWTELVGGDVILTIPYAWQVRFNTSGIDPRPRMAAPVDPAIIAELTTWLPDFRQAYEPAGLGPEAFDTYGATVRTLRGFIAAYHDLMGSVRDVMLPDPSRRTA
ncbi:MAG: transaldolase family protein [Candidatus Limnocylindrales bacterium]